MDELKEKQIVLVVEDDDLVAELLGFMLEREGMEVIRASDGRQAMEQLDSGRSFDMILMDVRLPYKDGFQLVQEARSRYLHQKIPIMMITAQTREGEISRALELGADDYLIKPFKPMELIARVKRLLKKTS